MLFIIVVCGEALQKEEEDVGRPTLPLFSPLQKEGRNTWELVWSFNPGIFVVRYVCGYSEDELGVN